MYLAIIILSLLGSIASGFFGRKIGVTGSQIITCTAVIMTTVFAIVAFFEVGLNNIPMSIELFRWIDSESLYVSWGFHFDSLTVSILIPVLIVFSLVHIYCSLPEGYKQYYKHLKLSVFVFGASTIIHTLGLNAIHSCLLIIVILVIIGFLHFWISYIAFLDNSALFIIVTVYILTDSLMTAEFCENFLNLSHIDLFLLHLGMARIIIGIVITKHQPSFFDRLKNTTELFLPYLKKNPMFYIIIGISVLLLFMITTNLLCWSLGLTLCKDNFFTFYIFIITKLILVNSTISLIMLAYTPSSMWYSIIAMSIWLPLFSIPFSFFYYFYVIPVLINLQWIPIQIDDLKANLSFSEPLFFLAARNMGDQLINMPNRLGQLGKLLTQWANWALDYKPESIRGRNTSANRTQKLGVGFYATNKNHLEHNYNKVSHWAMVKGWPKAAPVGISLPFSAKGSNTIDRGSNIINSSLCYKSISSCIVFTNFSLEVFNGSFHTFIQKSQNVSGFFSTMKNLAEVKFILSANSTVEFKWIGQNIVKVVCNDNSRAGFLESYKDIVKMDFIPGLASSIGPDCNLDVKEIEYSNPDTIFDIQAWLNGLTSKCSQTFASTEPNKIGFDCNPHVHMEWNPNYNNANEYNITNPDHSVRGDLLENTDYLDPNVIGDLLENTDYLDPNVIGDLLENTDYLDPNVIGDSENTNRVVSKELIREEGIEVRIHDLDPCWVYLKYDLSRLSGYTQDDNHDWKIYLHNILTEIRKVLIKFWGDDQDITEKATMANIDPDYGNDTVAVKEHFHALGRAINVVGGGNVDLNNFHLLGEKFVQSLNPYVYFSDAEESQLEYIGDPTISQLEDIENPTISQLEDIENPTVLSNNNLTVDTTGEISLSTPLAYSEIHDLTSELRDRLSKAESDRLNLSGSGMPVDKYKHNLYSLGMSVDKYGDKIVIRCNNKKDVHFLLSRLANTNKDIFTWKKNGDIKPGSNYVKPIITKLEQLMFDKLMSDNDPIDLSTPLAYSEIQDLINELRSRVSKVESDRLNLYSLGMSVSKSGGRIVILCNDKKDVHVLLSRLANTNKDIFTVKDGYIQPANSYIKTMYAKLEQWMFNYTPTVE